MTGKLVDIPLGNKVDRRVTDQAGEPVANPLGSLEGSTGEVREIKPRQHAAERHRVQKIDLSSDLAPGDIVCKL